MIAHTNKIQKEEGLYGTRLLLLHLHNRLSKSRDEGKKTAASTTKSELQIVYSYSKMRKRSLEDELELASQNKLASFSYSLSVWGDL